jgi:hypothetical protein
MKKLAKRGSAGWVLALLFMCAALGLSGCMQPEKDQGESGQAIVVDGTVFDLSGYETVPVKIAALEMGVKGLPQQSMTSEPEMTASIMLPVGYARFVVVASDSVVSSSFEQMQFKPRGSSTREILENAYQDNIINQWYASYADNPRSNERTGFETLGGQEALWFSFDTETVAQDGTIAAVPHRGKITVYQNVLYLFSEDMIGEDDEASAIVQAAYASVNFVR